MEYVQYLKNEDKRETQGEAETGERVSVCVRERERYMRGHDKTEEETKRYIEIDKITERKTGEERRKEMKPNQYIALLSNETGVQCSGINGQINLLLKP